MFLLRCHTDTCHMGTDNSSRAASKRMGKKQVIAKRTKNKTPEKGLNHDARGYIIAADVQHGVR